MFNGKMKAITFSYDDGVTQDIRLIEIFNKYGLKATFNINSELLGHSNSLLREGVTVSHNRIPLSDIRSVYKGHEIAAHTLNHPNLTTVKTDIEIIRQVEEDRQCLSALAGYEVVGFAYPGGGVNYNSRIAKLLKDNTGVNYCRTTVSSHSFTPQTDLYEFKPTVYHHVEFDKMTALAEEFLSATPNFPMLFYIWGHSYEFDIHNNWDKFEEFCEMISGKSDIFYGTNKECLLKDL